MGLFSRKKKPPRWAKELESRERFDLFVDVVLDVLADRDPPVEEWQVKSGSILLGELELALDEAVERCAQAEDDEWPEVVRDIIYNADENILGETRGRRRGKRRRKQRDPLVSNHTFTAGGETIDFENGDFSSIAPFLRAQILSPTSRGALEALDKSSLVMREVGGGLTATLVYDFGSHEVTVRAKNAKKWNASMDEIWSRAEENLSIDPIEHYTVETPGGPILAAGGNGNFVSSLVLRWRELFELDAPDGVLIGLPTWHAIMVHALVPPRSSKALVPMMGIVAELAEKLFDPVSKDIYYQAGPGEPLERVDYQDELRGPPALLDILAS